MSNAIGIAAVTAVLRNLLDNGLVEADFPAAGGSSVTVSALPPDQIPLTGTGGVRLNLFLYQVLPNPGWRNRSLPSRDSSGNRIENPPLALDLYYLLTAYGTADLQAELLLGYSMQIMHDTPGLSRSAIRTALTNPNTVGSTILPPPYRTLAADALATQPEGIKISPHFLSSEEMSKLWTALQGHYRPSVAYQASVVLISIPRRKRTALPVRESRIIATPLARPVLEDLRPIALTAGSTLTLQGSNLIGMNTTVMFGAIAALPSSATREEIRVVVPNTLKAGVNAARIRHDFDFGTPAEPHRGFESNSLPFLLQPSISPVAGGVFTVAPGGTLTVVASPPIAPEQQAELLVGDLGIPLPARAPGSAAVTQAAFAIPAGTTSGQLLRLRVDGADSPLQVDLTPGSPTENQFIGPRLTIA